MKKALRLTVPGIVFGALLGSAVAASAGEIYGTITEAGKPASAIELRLACGGENAGGKTDAYGSYRLKVAGTGKCALALPSKSGAPVLDVNLYDRPARYDLVLTQNAGKYTVARK